MIGAIYSVDVKDIDTSKIKDKQTRDTYNRFPICRYLMVGNLWTRIREIMISCIEE